jgi:hypothetical protein
VSRTIAEKHCGTPNQSREVRVNLIMLVEDIWLRSKTTPALFTYIVALFSGLVRLTPILV